MPPHAQLQRGRGRRLQRLPLVRIASQLGAVLAHVHAEDAIRGAIEEEETRVG